jgi:WhiB family redox-sensing transcriptional regulator
MALQNPPRAFYPEPPARPAAAPLVDYCQRCGDPLPASRSCSYCRSVRRLPPLGDWRLQAACADADPELFFPTAGDSRSARDARAICRDCPVLADCLDYSLQDASLDGIWAGTSYRQRAELRRRRGGMMRLRHARQGS